MELILLIVVSILIARYLERTRYRIAMMAHAVLFIATLVVYFFSGEIALFAALGKRWLGVETYMMVNDVFVDRVYIFSYGLSSLLAVEIFIMVSLVAVATFALIRSYKKVVKMIRLRSSGGYGYINPLLCHEDKQEVRCHDPPGKTYLILGRLRN